MDHVRNQLIYQHLSHAFMKQFMFPSYNSLVVFCAMVSCVSSSCYFPSLMNDMHSFPVISSYSFNFHPPSLLSDLCSFSVTFSLHTLLVSVQNVLFSSAAVSFILFFLTCFSSALLLLRNKSMVHRVLCQARYDTENDNNTMATEGKFANLKNQP